MTNDLFDVFATNAPQGGGDSGSKPADPLADIFAQGNQPLAEVPATDKLSMLQGFYNGE